MNWIKILLSAIVTLLIITREGVNCSGLFELRLNNFQNDNGRDSDGICCSRKIDPNTGKCLGTCKTRFRVCLKHYQAKIDTTSPCTFGDVVTPILGENTVNFKNLQNFENQTFTNPIQFAFNFAWPGTFTLIVEAWHDTNNSANARSNNLLIQRLSLQQVLDVSPEWKTNRSEAQYTWLDYDFRVTCDAHYYGPGCANLCRPRDDNFGHYTCSETGEIICLSGWEGKYCETAICAKGCDHGHCDNQPNQCICKAGYKGKLCNECEPYPGCLHGSCKEPWECHCNEGWGGTFCNQDLNYCTNHRPCQNGGTCSNEGRKLYTCKCPPGYAGDDCQIEISSCDNENPCQMGGICLNDPTTERGYRCECKKGWMGRYCDEKVVTCQDKPCLHGTCRDTIKGYQCDCPIGYSGRTCEIHVDNCNPNPCQNGGSCHVATTTQANQATTATQGAGAATANGTHECRCLSGFTGLWCEKNFDDCQGNPCHNGGTCIDMINQFRCACVPGYLGILCTEMVDLCLAKPCANGGSCKNLNNDYQCECRAGFTGKDCSIDIDECSSGPCHNGGTCFNRVNSFHCECKNGYHGMQCDEELSIASAATYNARQYDETTKAQQHHHQQHQQHQHHNNGRSDGLTGGQVVLIAILSVAMPLVAVIAACVVFCMKRKRKRDQEKDDAEARKQNEQNAVATLHHNSSVSGIGSMVGGLNGLSGLGGLGSVVKRGSSSGLQFDSSNPNIIKNTWDKSVNNIAANSSSASAADDCLLNASLYNSNAAHNHNHHNHHIHHNHNHNHNHHSVAMANYVAADNNNANSEFCGVAPLQRAKSQKQLNTDPTIMHRASQLLSGNSSNGSNSNASGGGVGGGSAVASGATKEFSDTPNGGKQQQQRISVLGESAYCSQRWPSVGGVSCATQILGSNTTTASSAATATVTTTQQQRPVVICGTPHM